MRLLILVFLIATVSCGRPANPISNNEAIVGSWNKEESIVGSWKLMGISKKPVEIERVAESDLMKGHVTFRPDKSFDGEITYPKSPEKNARVSGTYALADGMLTISNQPNNAPIKSALKFEKDFMIATPSNSNGFTLYYKRIS